jgi:hypothetical protein
MKYYLCARIGTSISSNPLSMNIRLRTTFTVLSLILFAAASAQEKKPPRKGEFYFSWGYNTEWYTRSNIHVNQPELNNDYAWTNIRAHDHKGWDDGLLHIALTIPQYNYRIGYFFDRVKGLGFELNFDHTKYIFTDGQDARLKGKLDGRQVDTTIKFLNSNGFYYYLNNGANFFLFNFVKRWKAIQTKDGNFKLDIVGKAGIGPVVPHVQNSFFNQPNKQHFQIGGWNVGVEGAVRATFFKYAYLEYCNKLDFAHYFGLRIYKGTAHQAFGTYEMIANIGATFPMGHRVHASAGAGH